MREKVSGFLEVGTNGKGEVVVNHPDLQADENGVGHIVFSPRQARNLAILLHKHSVIADEELDRAETSVRPETEKRTEPKVTGAPQTKGE